MRVVSRFAIIVLIFLVIIAVAGLDLASSRTKHSPLWIWIPMFFLAFSATRGIHNHFRKIEYPLHNKALRVLNQYPSSPLLILPFGDPWHDSMYMLQIADTTHPMIYGWGGFCPNFQRVMGVNYKLNINALLAVVEKVWPDPILILDKQGYTSLSQEQNELRELEKYCSKISEDERFAIYSMHSPEGSLAEYVKLTRSDLLEKNPILHFSAYTDQGIADNITVDVGVNQFTINRIAINATRKSFDIRIPKTDIDRYNPNIITIRSPGKEPFHVDDFSLGAYGNADVSFPLARLPIKK